MISRYKKIVRICQSHVAPGMSLERWREIMAAYQVDLAASDPWAAVPEDTLDAIVEHIGRIVISAKAQAKFEAERVLDPLDLYYPGEGLWRDNR